MNRLLRLMLWTSLGAVIVAGLLAALLIQHLPADGIRVTIDDETWTLPALHAGHWLLATLGLLLAAALLVIVVPLALLVGIGLPLVVAALAVGVSLALVLLATGLALSPLVLVGAIAWGLWRALVRPAAPPAATMHA